MKSMVEKETIAHPNVKKQALGLRSAIGSALKYTALSILSFISIFPFVWMILGMTNTPVDITSGKIKIGSNLIINFQNLFSNELNFTRSLWNSAMIALVTTVFALLISSMAGYGFEIYQSKRKDLIFNILLLSMMVSFAALMIPLYRMFSQLNGTILGINSFLVVILPSISTAFLIFFFRQNVKSFPKDLVEAARLDGLKELSIFFFRVYMPTAKNTYAAAAIITFMSSWNNYLWPLVALQSPDKRTVPLVLSAMGASYTPDYGMIMAGLVIATLPTAIVFFVLQKQFVQGMIGSVK
ncbi:carbohydrate ABC transporter permease [Enterococcus faecium]|nr:carbohydrate ABC transporter permease [Enterococcus faecium]NVE07644.1 carbohydrate ABC transporter permease [Enterococcus faecium]